MDELLFPALGIALISILALEVLPLFMNRFLIVIFLFILSPLVSNAYSVLVTRDVLETESLFSYIRVLLLWFCGAAGALYLLRLPKNDRPAVPLEIKLFLGFVLIAMVSVVRSVDARYSSIRSVSLLALLGIVLGLYAWLGEESRKASLLDAMFFTIVLILSVNVLFAVGFADKAWLLGTGTRLRGAFAHPNTLGSFCMVSYPIVIWKLAKSASFWRPSIIAVALAILGLHIASGSRGSLISSTLMGMFWLIMTRKVKVIAVAAMVLAAAFVVFQDRLASLETFSRTGGSEGQWLNLTGRDEIWAESMKLISRRPMVGYGYEVSAQIFDSPFALYKNPRLIWLAKMKGSFHNGYITIALGLGIAGLLLWLVLVISPLAGLIRRVKDQDVLVPLAIMSSCLILNFVEYTIGPASTPASISFWIAWTLSLRMVRSDGMRVNVPDGHPQTRSGA